MIRTIAVAALTGACVLCVQGCVSSSSKNPLPVRINDGGVPLSAAFVYTENIHSVNTDFALGGPYWEEFFPQAADVFRESRAFASYYEALQSKPDVLVVAENQVHGSPERFRFALKVSVLNRDEATLVVQTREEKSIGRDAYPGALGGFARLVAEKLEAHPKILALAREVEPDRYPDFH